MPLDYQQIFRELNNDGIDYVIVGGLAVNLHGIPRMTYDIDIAILLHESNIMRLVTRLRGWGYVPRAPVLPEELADEEKRNSWIREKNMRAFTFCNDKETLGEIDVMIDTRIPFCDLKARAILFDLGGVHVPVVSIPDLIEMKRHAGRRQDLADVDHLLTIMDQ
jgi:predicted nucleotidyltransferase